jgi:hypothetical protein
MENTRFPYGQQWHLNMSHRGTKACPYFSVVGSAVDYMQPGADSLFYVGFCQKSFASQRFLKGKTNANDGTRDWGCSDRDP